MLLTDKLYSLYHKTVAKNYFLCSFVLLWVYFIVLYPTLFREIFSEHGTNYLFYAYNKTFAENVWKDDAGYLVWLPRLIALLTSAIASPYWFIIITNLIAQSFLAFFASFINHPGFDNLLPRPVRFVLSLIFGMIILPNYEIFTYVNFAYTGFIFIGFLLFLNKENLSRGGVEYLFYCFLCALLCISKFHFVVFFPVFIAFMIYHWYKKERKSLIFYIPSLITILIQLGFVAFVMGRKEGALSYTLYHNSNIFHTVLSALRGVFLWITTYSTNFRFLGHAVLALAAGAVFLGFLSYSALKYYKNHLISAKIFYLFIVFNLVSLMFACISSLSHYTGISEMAFHNVPFFFGRRWSMSYNLVWLAVVILLLNLIFVGSEFIRKKRVYMGYLGVFFILSLFTTAPKIFKKGQYISKGNDMSLSDWENLHILLKNEKYYIPFDPFPHGLYAANFHQGVAVAQISENIYAPQKAFTNYMTVLPDYDQQSFSPEGDLLTQKVWQEQKKITALIVGYPQNEAIYALAFDDRGQAIAYVPMVSSAKTMYKYLLFDIPVAAARIRFFNEQDEVLGNQVIMAAVYIQQD